MIKSNLYILSIVVLVSLTGLVCFAKKEDPSKFLPKTKDTAKDADDKSDSNDINNEEEVSNPEDNFKLIAIYLVENKPHALIKNLEKPEDPAKEFQVGDYVDELQTFLISKILFNPTTRIELIDLNGLSYVLKEKNTDSPNNSTSSKSSPSYSSGGNKIKIKRATTTSVKTATEGASATIAKPTEKKEESTSLESAVKNDAASTTTTPAQPPPEPVQNTAPAQQDTNSTQAQSTLGGTPQAQSNTTATPSAGNTDSMSTSGGAVADPPRPSNPFGE